MKYLRSARLFRRELRLRLRRRQRLAAGQNSRERYSRERKETDRHESLNFRSERTGRHL
jgi:hypothetical protein